MSAENTSKTEEMVSASPRPGRELRIPIGTVLKLIGSALGVWAVFLLWSECLLFLVAVLLAVTLHPGIVWMERRRIVRGLGVAIVGTVTVGLVALFVLFVLPPLTRQMTLLVRDFPNLGARILSKIPDRYPGAQDVIRAVFASPSPKAIGMLERSFAWGESAISGLVVAATVFVVTLYLLIDGKSLYAWLLAFVPRTHREKMAATMGEVSDVVHAYMSGLLLAALLFAIFAGALLTVLRVPAVVPLAVIAGLSIGVPVLGILLATALAVLLALTVSPGTAIAVAGAYVAYHLFETSFLLPRIYGNKLKMSTLAVLLALIVGGKLQGIIGIVLVLPLVAAYPIIERHWLAGYLHSRVLTDHKALAEAAETGSEAAIATVLLGEKHASEGLLQAGAPDDAPSAQGVTGLSRERGE